MKRPDLLPTTLEGKKDKITEEMGEVLQAIGKASLYGYYATDAVTGKTYNNKADIINEMNDLRHAMDRYEEALKEVTAPCKCVTCECE